jgi:pimeloyl-ACP methyl ester carboxylesterase
MTIVLLHGVPETADIWDGVRAELDEPSVALRLPGFGCARPDGFSATKDAYVDWLLDELKGIEGPIDLVGHDWGGGFTARVGTAYPDAVRSWTIDVAGVIHPDYVWHDFAQIWQTPGEGEKFWEDALAAPPDPTGPMAMADATMASCILDLYRSATPNPHKDWGEGYAPSQKPCMVMTLTADPFTGGTAMSSEAAKVLGAKEVMFEIGHFWPLESPVEGARIINEFVASL